MRALLASTTAQSATRSAMSRQPVYGMDHQARQGLLQAGGIQVAAADRTKIEEDCAHTAIPLLAFANYRAAVACSYYQAALGNQSTVTGSSESYRIAGAHANKPRASRWPARLDLAQSASGLVLGLFMWAHMLFVSTILISADAFWTVARFFEGAWLLPGTPQPLLVSVIVAAVWLLVVVHAALALRKFPASYRQYTAFHQTPATPGSPGHDALVLAGRLPASPCSSWWPFTSSPCW